MHIASQNWCLYFDANCILLASSSDTAGATQSPSTPWAAPVHCAADDRATAPRSTLSSIIPALRYLAKGNWIRLLLDWNFPVNSYKHASRRRRPSPELFDKA
ncbi:hypothetical protein NHJ13051_005844 [Beauveria bassiana]